MSQVSQFSDIYSSSAYEVDTTDNLQFPFSEDGQLYTPDPLGSQQTLSSVPDPDFLRPPPPPPIPDTLQLVGPDRTKGYILYSNMSKDDFVTWWLRTDFGKGRRNHWDSIHQSDCWKHFEQVADKKTGKPAVMCNQCGKILDHPANGRTGTSSMNKHIRGVNCRRAASKKPNIKHLMANATQHASTRSPAFTKEAWEQKLLKLLAISRLPFQFIEHPEFHDVINFARLAPSRPEIPSAKAIRNRLRDYVKEQQQSLLQKLPSDAKLSLALDCWTSPFQQAFMAVTGYFLDVDWEYREILLGFEPLSGTHSGVNLSDVLLKLLQQHDIADRVLAITTDNASNNNTLISSIQDSLQSLELDNGSMIIRVPCIAHIIQLSLKDLLGQIKANPKNETQEMQWSEGHVQSLRARQQKREIIDTLNKVRTLAVYINASPQRRETFFNLQCEEPKLVPIQDVKTRWNSTYLMLRRAKRLQSTIDAFCLQYHQDHFALNNEEWRQIEYLLYITQPFFKFTTLLSQTKEVSIHLVFSIYNKLFDHLEKSIRRLQRKKVSWKQMMLTALRAAKGKLSHYYSMTDDIHGDPYAIGTIIAPQQKLQFFSTKDWDNDWRERYRTSLKDYLQPYQRRHSDTQPGSNAYSSAVAISELEMICGPEESQKLLPDQPDELTKYLESGTVRTPPRIFWKDHQHEFPALASLARDILSIPATGAGVERLFNSARDVCHYRRGSLNPQTIQDLMMFMCTSKFEIEEEQRILINEYLTHEEIQAVNEENNIQENDFEPISDDDEEEEEDNTAPILTQPMPQAPSERAQRKRRRSVASEPEIEEATETGDDEAVLPLPETQQRVSGRSRKRSKLLDGYELG